MTRSLDSNIEVSYIPETFETLLRKSLTIEDMNASYSSYALDNINNHPNMPKIDSNCFKFKQHMIQLEGELERQNYDETPGSFDDYFADETPANLL